MYHLDAKCTNTLWVLDEIEEKHEFETQDTSDPRCILDCYVIGYYHDAMFGKLPIVAFIDKHNGNEGLMAPDHITLRCILASYKAGTYDRLPKKIKALIHQYEQKCIDEMSSL